MKIKTEIVNLHSFSIKGYILPTFQKAKLKTVSSFFKKKKLLQFSYFENYGDNVDSLKTVIIKVK